MSGLLGRGARLAAASSSRRPVSAALAAPRRSLAVASPESLPGAADRGAPFVKIVEVSPRDGLQNEKSAVSVETKVELIRRLQDAGVCAIEAGSFVSPKWVPQMADTSRVLTSMPLKAGISYPVLVPNARGLDDLLSLLSSHKGKTPTPLTDEIAIFTAATESFTRKNTNVSIAESLDRLAAVTQKALAQGLKVRGYISVVAGCPYEGQVDPRVCGDIADKLLQMGCYEVSLGDTVGVGHPGSMLAVLNECVRHGDVEHFAAHCHDTFGTGMANVLAMVNAGVRVVDAAVGGLGGCPYSPGATGNIDTESVVYALHREGYETGIDIEKAAEAGQWIAQAVGKENGSRAGRAVLAQQKLQQQRQAQAQGQQARGYHTSAREARRYASSSAKRGASAVTHSQPGPSPPPPTPMPNPPADAKVLRHSSIPDLEITLLPTSISLVCPSHSIPHPFELDHTWLRDVCPEVGSSIQAGTGQKLFGTTDVPLTTEGGLLDEANPPRIEAHPESGELVLVLTYSTQAPVLNAFSTTFSPSPPQPPKEPHVSRVPLRTLLLHASEAAYRSQWHLDPAGVAQPWAAVDLVKLPEPLKEKPSLAGEVQPTGLDDKLAHARPSMVDYSALLPAAPQASEARWSLANALLRDGLAFVRGLPTDVKSGTSLEGERVPELAKLANMLGEVRNTFYGPLWDVRSLPASTSRNIAYTNVDLGLHMDLLYFQNPPRFQLLHMLRNDVLGGASIFTDSFAIARRMWQEDRSTFDLLCEVPIAYQYDNDGRYYRYTHPLFERPSAAGLGHEGGPFDVPGQGVGKGEGEVEEEMPRLVAVNYSPPFQAPLPLTAHPALIDPAQRARFYAGLKRFADLTLEPEFRVERQLSEGECVLFDNRRVLHSRKGFEFVEGEVSEGEEGKYKRWLKGCYIDGDAVWSSWRVLERERRVRGGV